MYVGRRPGTIAQEVEELTGQLRALEARVVEVARRGDTGGKARAEKGGN